MREEKKIPRGVTPEQKPAALDEDALESVTGGGIREWQKQAWEQIRGHSGSDNDKE